MTLTLLTAVVIHLLDLYFKSQLGWMEKKKKGHFFRMFFCVDACTHRREVTQFLPLEEAAEGMGRGTSLPVLLRGLPVPDTDNNGQKLPGKRLKISLCS